MKVVIDATPAEIVRTLELLKNGEYISTTDGRIFCTLTNKPDQATHAASDYSRGMESYFVGPQSQCVGQPTMGVGQPTFAGGDEYGKQ